MDLRTRTGPYLSLILAGVLSVAVLGGTLEKPTLTEISLHKAVKPGEHVEFNCSCNNQNVSEYRLLRNGQLIDNKTASYSVTFNFSVDPSHFSNYSCQLFQKYHSISPPCRNIFITVVDLQKPKISFSSSPDKESSWWFQDSEVTQGHSFFINCSTKPQFSGGSFHLELNGHNIRTQSAVNNVFEFSEADFTKHGNYNCVYEVNVSSRTFTSSSTQLSVKVKASPVPYIASGVTAGVLLIVLLTILCIIKRRRRPKKIMQSNKPYGTEEANEVYDQDDYENAEVISQKENSEVSNEDYVDIDAETEDSAKGFKNGRQKTIACLGEELEEDEADYENTGTVFPEEEGRDDGEDYIDMEGPNKKTQEDLDEDVYIFPERTNKINPEVVMENEVTKMEDEYEEDYENTDFCNVQGEDSDTADEDYINVSCGDS
ncbi:uncharacterized protein [Hoplias malabaricus]|uniref:uncharacterized protein isoform X2 n=1 Tax=Hoplias malabaricus TaxID=27720 RepID=UPI0034626892